LAGPLLERFGDEQRQEVAEPAEAGAAAADGGGRRGEDVAADAGAVLEELADGDAPGDVGVGVVGPGARQRGVEVELARLV
jgi:hypothetical protein